MATLVTPPAEKQQLGGIRFAEEKLESAVEAGKIYYPESDGEPMAETDFHIDQIIDLRLYLLH